MPAGVHPPAAFASRVLDIKVEPAGGIWRRLYGSVHPDPLGFGLGLSRFSDPSGRAFRVIYLGSSIKVAIVEVVLRDRGDGEVGKVPIPYAELESLTCAELEIAKDLRLIDLSGDGALRMGVPADVVGARDQTLSRMWSAAFHAHAEDVDGIYYPSRLNEERNIALYQRGVAKFRQVSTPRLLECRSELASVIQDLNLAIV
jgi:hypothetical protein